MNGDFHWSERLTLEVTPDVKFYATCLRHDRDRAKVQSRFASRCNSVSYKCPLFTLDANQPRLKHRHALRA